VRAASTADATGLLRKVLQRAGIWPGLVSQGERAAAALRALLGTRDWPALDAALAALDANAPLALATGAALDLRALRAELHRGRACDAQAGAQLESARRLAAAGRPAEALDLLLAAPSADGLEPRHYRALAAEARALFVQAASGLPHAQRTALITRLDALVHLAGEPPIERERAVSMLAVIQAEAAQTVGEMESSWGGD